MVDEAVAFWISVGSAALALAVFTVALLVLRGGRRVAGPAIPDAVAVVDAIRRAEDERARAETAREDAEQHRRHSRRMAALGRTLSVEEVARETLTAAQEVTRADGALVRVRREDGSYLTWASGLTADEQGTVGAAVGDPADLRAVVSRFRWERDPAPGNTLGVAVGVPLPGQPGPLGSLHVLWRGRGPDDPGRELEHLEELAAEASVSLANALRFAEARDLADRDSLTRLYNRRYFYESLEREVERSNRYQRSLALIVLDVDNFKELNDRVGHLAGDRILAEAAERLSSALRRTDLACRVGGDEFAAILPESGVTDAEQLYGRIQAALTREPFELGQPVQMSGGIAQLIRGETAVALFERADRALYRAKRSGRGRVVFDDVHRRATD